jgi:hypothetical protein
MASGDFVFRSQDVNYLGFLEAQLRDLQGIDTLAFELVQNADDVQPGEGSAPPRWITFDLADEALIVSNDGVFRPVDFTRMQDLAGGGKREEAGTTGAFGIGFLAVYQITDRPEIISGGRHWVIRPEAEPAERIEERPVATEDTILRLPWALDERSGVRRALRLPAVQPAQLDAYAAAFAGAIELASLFLRQLQKLEVRRNGRLVRRIEREQCGEGELCLHDESGETRRWLLLEGDFAAAAAALRARYPWQLESHRASSVTLALPLTSPLEQGRLFASLPSETAAPLPFHVNADFFPTTDRKRIHLQSGYQAEWNEAALTAAARLLAHNLGRLRAALPPVDFWQALAQIAATGRMAQQGDLPSIFAAFWHELARRLPQEPVAYTLAGEWCLPSRARLWEHRLAAPMREVLAALQLAVVHPDLRPYFSLLRQDEVGVPALAAADIVQALLDAGLAQATPLSTAPSFLCSLEQLQALWQLLDPLLQVAPEARAGALAAITQCAIVLTEQMELQRLDRVYRGSAAVKSLFPQVAWLHELAPEDAFPGRYVPEYGARQAVDLLAATPLDQLESDWRLGRLDLPRLFRWFESRQIEIFGDDPALATAIRRLPLGPVAGELRPLAELYIPGGFSDPLGVAGIVELEALGGRREFLWDLGMEELRFETYLHEQMPRALLHNPDLPSDARHRLLQLLAGRLGEFRDDEELQEQLHALPLVPAMDGSFRSAGDVYADRQARVLLGEGAHIAEPPENKAMAALYDWLGVRQLPDAPQLIAALLQLDAEVVAQPAAGRTAGANAHAIWRRLAALLVEGRAAAAELAPLRERAVIVDAAGNWRRPDELFFAGEPDLAVQFPALVERLLPPGDAAAVAYAAAGVRPLAQALQQRLLVTEPTAEAPEVAGRVATRAPLIRRILHVELEPPDRRDAMSLLEQLQVRRAAQLRRTWSLMSGDEELAGEPEDVAAGLDSQDRILYVHAGESIPWLAISRELVRAFTPERVAGGLTIALREVLAAETAAEASRLLDELGYPPPGSV